MLQFYFLNFTYINASLSSVSLSVYSDNSLLLLAWIFPTSVLTFTLGYRIFWLYGGWGHHECNKFQHLLVDGFLKSTLAFLFFNFKVLIDPLDMKMQQLGFCDSWREAWPSCVSFLSSWLHSDNLYTSFFTVWIKNTFLLCILNNISGLFFAFWEKFQES